MQRKKRVKKNRVLIAAGGTGGHILPVVVFGRWLEARHEASVSYLAGGRPLEREIYASLRDRKSVV